MTDRPVINQIVAMARNRVIGNGLEIPWRISEDFKHFKKVTMGHAMIMGRRTWDSIGRALPGRLTVVVTRDQGFVLPEGVLRAGSLDEALRLCRERRGEWGDEIFIAGGGEIYRQSLPLADRIYLTVVDLEPAGDVFYPELRESDFAREVLGTLDRSGDTPGCTWYLLTRKKS